MALESLFPGDRISRRSFRRLLASPQTALCLIADDLGAVEGYALILLRRNTRVARLYSLVVAPEVRGQGFGFRLVTGALVSARKLGCRCLRLEVRADNASAIELYRRMGFHEIGRVPNYYSDGETAIRFESELPVEPRDA
jgi:ribosomal protein S18 acetylase RimI-like enzyme